MMTHWPWLLIGSLCWTAMAAALELTPQEAAGKRIYLEGTGSSDAPIYALVGASDTSIPASALPCGNCHGADGRGRPEGGVRPPDITWQRLTKAYGQRLDSGRSYPAYDEAALVRALSEGRDPAGNRLDPAMPRFVMSLRDMTDLSAYLKRLEDDRDPGLEDELLRIGTLLPAKGSLAASGETVAAVLAGVIGGINDAGGIYGRKLELVIADPGPDRRSAEAALHRLLAQQIFALVAPLAPAFEGHFADLIEASGLPLIGPLTQLAEEHSSRLVFDPLPGLREQLFALGDYASAHLELSDPLASIVYPQDSRLRPLAEALEIRLQGQGWSRVRLLGYRPDSLENMADRLPRGTQAVFFLGASDAFAALTERLRDAQPSPYLFAASTQVGAAAMQAPRRFSDRLFLSYPFLPGDWTPSGVADLLEVRQRGGIGGQHALMQVGAYSAAMLLGEGLKRAGRDASREKLVTALENLHGFHTGLTPVLGFGPGKRVGAAGAHIVKVDIQGQRFWPTGRYIRVDPRL